MITGIHHVQISVPPGGDDSVRKFYGGLLKMSELALPDSVQGRGLIWFGAGPHLQLHVNVEDGIDRHATRAHTAYETDDIAGCRLRLQSAGYELFDQPVVPGFDRFHVVDPFGNRLEIIQSIR